MMFYYMYARNYVSNNILDLFIDPVYDVILHVHNRKYCSRAAVGQSS